MPDPKPDEESIFNIARSIKSLTQRDRYLRQVCGGDPALEARVRALLEVHEQESSFLAPAGFGSSAGLTTNEKASSTEMLGISIGPYRLLEQIGEGGMGTVWMAKQTEPVKRFVALKLIKAGMDSKQIIARFEAERQALALMDHPNIARVLDAGTVSEVRGAKSELSAAESSDLYQSVVQGRPYFVMDLVKGVPITKYCDEKHLTPRQRLELFIPVCHAVQHAHQKGIIHRDLKPSNVLIALYDNKPVPKVIDFGVAKATGQALTEKTLVTGFGALVGTLEYMSPEQAEINQLDIDTRSDIYSLGVLLYELLTGSPPFSRKELETVGMFEMLRVIREKEPSKPSTKLSTAEGLPTLAANRGTEPAKLTRLLRGELDWIVMKALEKDRNRRYESATGLAMDLLRYLADEPVQAGPPSALYRFRKFARKYQAALTTGAAIVLLLVAGIIGTTWGLFRAERNRQLAEANELDALTEKAKALSERDAKNQALADMTNARASEKQARDHAMAALRAMADDLVENQMARGTELTDQNKEFLRKIIKHFESFSAITADDAASRAIRAEGNARVGLMRYRLGEFKEAEAAATEALALLKQLAMDSPNSPELRTQLARTQNNLGALFSDTGRINEAEAAFTDAAAVFRQLAADFPTRPEFRQGLAASYSNLGKLLNSSRRPQQAEVAYAEAHATRKLLVEEFPANPEFRRELAISHQNQGLVLSAAGKIREAEAAYLDALSIRKQLADEFPLRIELRQELARSHNSLGTLLRATDRPEEAKSTYADALAIQKQLAADYPARPDLQFELARIQNNLGNLLGDMGQTMDAKIAFGDGLAIYRQLAADFPNRTEFRHELARCQINLALLLKATGLLIEAEASFGESLGILHPLAASFPAHTEFRHTMARAYYNMGALLSSTGQLQKAEAAYNSALVIQRQLLPVMSKQPDLRNELAGTLVGLAYLFSHRRDFQAAKVQLEEAEPHHGAALTANPRHPSYRQSYRDNLLQLAYARAGLLDQDGAVQAAERIRNLGWNTPADAYDAARALALCIRLVAKPESEPAAKAAQFYGDQAMTMLKRAVAEGYKNVGQMKQDKDLNPLREREDFQVLLAELDTTIPE